MAALFHMSFLTSAIQYGTSAERIFDCYVSWRGNLYRYWLSGKEFQESFSLDPEYYLGKVFQLAQCSTRDKIGHVFYRLEGATGVADVPVARQATCGWLSAIIHLSFDSWDAGRCHGIPMRSA